MQLSKDFTMPISASPSRSSQASRLRGKIAALAGATGAVAAGTAEAVPYTPTAGVVAAQGIPGFSFVSPSSVTLGNLRPPATNGTVTWDIDGGGAEFDLLNQSGTVARLAAADSSVDLRGFFNEGFFIQNLATGANVDTAPAGGLWAIENVAVTANGQPSAVSGFSVNTSGQFGFRFYDSAAQNYRYGWGSMVIEGATLGSGFKITEAYYTDTPGTTINVGAVPVPEPANIALLALGSAGVTAWRLRRKQRQVG
jgi:hypothetical protein